MSHDVVFREEFFGSIVYNSFDEEYYYFDKEETEAVKQIYAGKKGGALQEFCADLEESHLLSKRTELLNHQKPGALSSPLKVFLDTTYRCNLQCPQCFTNSRFHHPDELNSQEIFSLIRQMKAAGTCMLALAGGEPLLRPDFFDIVHYAVDHDINVGMTTNGTCLTESSAKRLHDTGISMITVSLDGMEKAHDALRGEGVWKKVERNLRMVRKQCRDAFICIRFTMNSLNLFDYEPVLRLAEELGVDMVKFNPIRCFGRAQLNRHLLITQEQYVQFIQNVQNVSTKVRYSLPKTPLDSCEYEFIDLGFGCTGGKETCNITPTGEFSACAFLGNEFVVGNIKTSSFMDLWSKTQKTVCYTGNEMCNSCSDYRNCRAGCRSRALFEYGNIDAIDPHCTIGKAVQGKLTIRKEPNGYIVYDFKKSSYKGFDSFESIRGEYLPLIQNKQYRLVENAISVPLKVFWDSTGACNSRCIHCYNNSKEAFPEELTTDEVQQLARQLYELGIHQISIGGGEPFLRKDMFDLVRILNAHDVEVSITTNGLLLSKGYAEQLNSCRIKQLTISIDGVTPEKYLEFRGVDGLSCLQENLVLIKEHFAGELAMRVSIMRGNMDAAQTIAYAMKQGFTTLKINKTHGLGRFMLHPEYAVSDAEYDSCIDSFVALQKESPITIELPREKYLNEKGPRPCSAGKKTIFISPNGQIFPCAFGPGSFCFGSIRKQALLKTLLECQSFSTDNDFCYSCPGMKKSHCVTKTSLITR